MIKNERQYRITKAQADRFSQTLHSLRKRPRETKEVHPLIDKAQEDALNSQIADLKGELREYESLKAGKFQLDELNVIADLPAVLIKARNRTRSESEGPGRPNRAEGTADTEVRGHRLRIRQSHSNQEGCKRLGCGE